MKADVYSSVQSNLGLISPMGAWRDGIFLGYDNVIYHGKSANGREFNYSFYTNFEWDNVPKLCFLDEMATLWDGATRMQISGSYYEWLTDGPKSFSGFDVCSKNGSKITVKPGWMAYGFMNTKVAIPVHGNVGTHYEFSSFMSIATFQIGMSINWGPVISISGLGDKWTWSSTFKLPEN